MAICAWPRKHLKGSSIYGEVYILLTRSLKPHGPPFSSQPDGRRVFTQAFNPSKAERLGFQIRTRQPNPRRNKKSYRHGKERGLRVQGVDSVPSQQPLALGPRYLLQAFFGESLRCPPGLLDSKAAFKKQKTCLKKDLTKQIGDLGKRCSRKRRKMVSKPRQSQARFSEPGKKAQPLPLLFLGCGMHESMRGCGRLAHDSSSH